MVLDHIALFQLIVGQGSLTGAAREAGLSSTTVSERLSALEAHYGVVLLNRTTRKISLTDEGRTLLEGGQRVLEEVAELDTRIRHGAQVLSGPIRVSAPRDLGRTIISEATTRFLASHPAVSIELQLSDGFVDLVGRGLDIVVRFGLTTDSSLRVRSLAPIRRVVCAAPAYLEREGQPVKPTDLKHHNCLVMRFGSTLDNIWHFGSNSMKQTVAVDGDRVSNDGVLVHQWALDGHGIVLKSELDVGSELANGQLIELLPELAAPPVPLQILFPPSRAQPRRVNALADHLANAIHEAHGYTMPPPLPVTTGRSRATRAR